jgi:PTH1 family peptidyl-tRNA hydrolase
MLVIYDDIDLPEATLRIRKNGSAGTHNGMRDVIAKTGTQDFARVRIGIGKPPAYVPLADYVLSVVPLDKRTAFDKAIDQASEAALKFIDGKLFVESTPN